MLISLFLLVKFIIIKGVLGSTKIRSTTSFICLNNIDKIMPSKKPF